MVDAWDNPTVAADASLTWEWRRANTPDWVDPYVDADPFDQTYCDQLHIDYIALWVWNEIWEQWWADPAWTFFEECAAWDNPADDAFWGTDVYSGLHINDFLVAGSYKFYLGFYSAEDLLLFWDSAGQTGDSIDGVLVDDVTLGGVPNLYVTVFDDDEESMEFGALAVNLIWHQTEGGTFDNCANSNVATMGFLLRNDGWVAAEVPLSNGIECLDWLIFEEVPVLANSYELLVSAISDDDQFLWHHLCTGLDPEVGATGETAVGSVCEVVNQLE
jgi:hypothetical protein